MSNWFENLVPLDDVAIHTPGVQIASGGKFHLYVEKCNVREIVTALNVSPFDPQGNPSFRVSFTPGGKVRNVFLSVEFMSWSTADYCELSWSGLLIEQRDAFIEALRYYGAGDDVINDFNDHLIVAVRAAVADISNLMG